MSAVHSLVGDSASLGDCKQVSGHGKGIWLPPWAARCVQQPGMLQTDDVVGPQPGARRRQTQSASAASVAMHDPPCCLGQATAELRLHLHGQFVCSSSVCKPDHPLYRGGSCPCTPPLDPAA